MDDVLFVIVAASVILMFAGVIVFMGTDAFNNFNNETNSSTSEARCSFQCQRLEQGVITEAQVPERCDCQAYGID